MKKPLIVAIVAVALIAVFTLLIPPISAVIDDGSFYAVLVENGLYKVDEGGSNTVYGVGEAPSRAPGAILPVKLIRGLCGQTFDIRLLAALYLLLYVSGLYFGLSALSERPGRAGIFGVILAALMFADGGYLSRFNSFYPEAATFCAFILMCGSLFYALRGSKSTPLALLAFLLSSLWLAFTGRYQAILGILAALMAARLCFVLKGACLRAIAGVGAAAILFGSVFSFNYLSEPKRDVNLYHSVFYGILPDSKNPEGDLAELGLEPKLSEFAGSTYYEKGEEIPRSFYENINYGKILSFYIKHPVRLIKALNRAAKNSFFIRAEYLRPPAGGKPEITIWSDIKRILPHLFIVLVVFTALTAFFAIRRGGRFRDGVLFVLGAAVIYYIMPVVLSGQAAVDKEMFMFNAAFDILILIAAVFCIEEAAKRRERLKNLYGIK